MDSNSSRTSSIGLSRYFLPWNCGTEQNSQLNGQPAVVIIPEYRYLYLSFKYFLSGRNPRYNSIGVRTPSYLFWRQPFSKSLIIFSHVVTASLVTTQSTYFSASSG